MFQTLARESLKENSQVQRSACM